MKISILTIALIFATCLHQISAACNLPVPLSLKLKNQTSCSVDVSWKAVTGAAYYIVEYKVSTGSTWMFSNHISGTSITMAGLSANTSYDFAVASFCIDNTTIGYSASLAKTTKKCSTPANISASSVTFNSAIISWTPLCGSSNFSLQYRVQGVSAWTKISNLSNSSQILSNLQTSTTYEYRVQADCGSVKSSWSSILTFKTLNPNATKKNILLIVLDDGRYDAFTPNGGPSWFSTPAINSIADEGVNFKVMIPTTSQCGPSRACIYTGVYPHVNGVMKNGDTLNNSFPLIQQILKDNDYYTGFVGKYGQFLGDPKGFNWWAVSNTDEYVDPPYKINGKDTAISGHIIDVYPQLAKKFLNSVPSGQNFVLYYFTRVPHAPTIPRSQDSLLYLDEQLPFPSNYSFYTNNYPSFYEEEIWNADTPKVKALKLAMYQTLKGADENVDSILHWILQKEGTLDSTLIIFTSDNGFIMGEHHMREKIVALEESIRVPLFMRYPNWFGANSLISDEIASNVDIATTLLDFTGIPNTFGFQGLSLHQLANGQQERKNFLYETGWDPFVSRLRAVRTLNDIYIRSYCKTTCEEYYDLVADPQNNTNLIFNPEYATTIAQRRILLDSLRSVYDDILPKTRSCSLIASGQRLVIYNTHGESPDIEMSLGPNPAANSFNLYFSSHDKSSATIFVYDGLGHVLWKQSYSNTLDVIDEIDCSQWSNGIYFVKAEQAGNLYSQKIVVNR